MVKWGAVRVVDLLSVRWFDGLVVSEFHLARQDSAVRRSLAAVANSCIDQPGLLEVGDESLRSSASGLVVSHEVGNPRADRLTFRVHLTGLWMSPGGSLIAVVPRNSNEAGTAIEASSRADRRGSELLCLGVEEGPDFADGGIPIDVATGKQMEVLRPRLTASLQTAESLRRRIQDGTCDEVPIARILYGPDSGPTVDAGYIPPLTRLGLLAHFDSTAVPELEKRLLDLLSSVSRHATYAATMQQRDASTPLYIRQRAYESLRDILLARAGISPDLKSVSPCRFAREILQPIAAWWVHVFRPGLSDRLGEHADSVNTAAQRIAKLKGEDFALGTSDLLADARQLLRGLNLVLERVG